MSGLMRPHYAAYQGWAGGGSGGGVGGGGGGNQTVVDKALPDMIAIIDPYWYQFPPINPLWHGILGFVVCVLTFIAITGNGMVIFIFATTKSLRTPSNLYIINLAFSDFCLMSTMGIPVIINCYYETWVFGPFMCIIYGLVGSLFGCGSIYTMMMIAFDRYNVIVKGLAGKPLTIKGALFRIFMIWTVSTAWTVAPLFGWGKYTPEGNLTACGTDYLSKDWLTRSYVLVYASFCYFTPLFLIIYSYYFILSAVSAHEKNMREQAKKMNVASLRSSENANASAEGKLAKVALMTISLWFMAWTPYLVINFCGIFETHKMTPLFTIWGSVFAKANSVYNPIVYAISHPKYRAALNARFPSLVCGNTALPSDAQSAVTTVSEPEKA
ncbi:hypothetical protein HCN44_002430 [Aphidius gifuensis]|uniref:G-protein coupled receptors family 1 profile domain-containing protein n=1 Tax=Aphidius gifuensis TaxID=684658 RepID=A0A835CV25_APHGI|nr:rhodopsin-like [Aphidius gifuensis]KAF7996784.1 hypothetical protein HCN44_002430 [Aphidius gifuensis]